MKEFTSKAALGRYIKGLLKEADIGDTLNLEDKSLLIDLIGQHPSADIKIGCGIANIIIRQDPIWKKNKQFMIIRDDGSMIDFSYKICLYGERRSKLDMFRIACRTAVSLDIIRFKRENLKPDSICPHLGIPLTEDNAHVDHVKPLTFNLLVDEFIYNHALNIEDVIIEGELQKRFVDPGLAAKFRHFHNIVGVLELVSEKANQTVCKS